MTRSKWKGPFVNPKLLSKIERYEKESNMRPIRLYSRSTIITPKMSDRWFEVHVGKGFKKILVKSTMIGHKFGEFVPTRKFVKHSGAKVKSRVKIKS